jgi:hypothetical protein
MEQKFFFKLTFTFVLSFFCNYVFAQTTKVYGKVIDAQTKETLPFVNLVFKGTQIGTTTDINGKYVIETNQKVDSLMVSYLGYQTLAKKVDRFKSQQVNFEMQSSSIELKEFVVKAGENPAHAILRNIWKNKKDNDKDKLPYYQYEAYNKIEFDVNNINEEYRSKKIFKGFEFIFDYIDSTGQKPYLPMFISESVADVYYRRDPKTYREHVKALKVSGMKNESVEKFMADMFQSVNIYDNYISVFNKSFVSPIATIGLMYYKYYLVDSAFIGNNWCYQINFMPKRVQEPTFSGQFWVTDTTFAIREIDVSMGADANINFVHDFSFKQRFELHDSIWIMTKDQLVVDFNFTENSFGFYGRRSTSLKDIVLNKPAPEKMYRGNEKIIMLEGADNKPLEYWDTARHDSLSTQEKAIYTMVDSVKNMPKFKSYVEIIEAIFGGYKDFDKISIGPYFNVYSYNLVEGHRFRLGMRTSKKFSENLRLESYLAYGVKDNRFKYGGSFVYFLSKKPRSFFGASYKNDMEQLGQSPNPIRQDNILASVFRRNPFDKLTLVEEIRTYIEQEWFTGFSTRVILNHRKLYPKGSLKYENIASDGTINSFPDIKTSDVTLIARFAYKERYIDGKFNRRSLGSNYPIFTSTYTYGIKGLFGSDYTYHKVSLNITGRLGTGAWGRLMYVFEGGKTFGVLPYPLLDIPMGNETVFYDRFTYNMMNFFEFVSDEYVSASFSQHLNGFFFNKIPLFRKLKWREVLLFKGVWGNLRSSNRKEYTLPENMFSLSRGPYLEAGAGIENIFKILRVDAMWRLTYLDNPNVLKFGIRLSLQLDI